jgi:hypothetical protein
LRVGIVTVTKQNRQGRQDRQEMKKLHFANAITLAAFLGALDDCGGSGLVS